MALLVTSVFSVAGCGSDDDVDVESRVRNSKIDDLAIRADPTLRSDLDSDDMIDYDDEYEDDIAPRLDASDAPSEADCDRLDRLALSYLITRLDRDILDLSDLRNLSDRDLLDLLEGRNFLELYDSCTDALISGNYAPEGDDVDGG